MFETLTGFPEGLADQVRDNLQLDETRLISLAKSGRGYMSYDIAF